MARKSRKHLEGNISTAAVESGYTVAGYVRLSSEDRYRKGDSIETQKSIIENYITLSEDLTLKGFYSDNGISGTTFERPSFQKMLSDAESGAINCIVVKDLSRFGRNAIDTGYYLEKYLPSLKVRFIAVNDGFDSAKDTGNGTGVIIPLKNMINEAYALDIGRKVKSAKRQSMLRGEYIISRPPYGYLKSAVERNRLVVDEEAAVTVRRIFEWALEGKSVNAITSLLNKEGVLPPRFYKQHKGIVSGSQIWSNTGWNYFQVHKMLRNEIYLGVTIQGTSGKLNNKRCIVEPEKWIVVPDTHEPLISRELFGRVQAVLNRDGGKTKKLPRKPSAPNMYKGKIFCGHCGLSLYRGHYKDRYFFLCRANTVVRTESCKGHTLPEELLNSALAETVTKLASAVCGKNLGQAVLAGTGNAGENAARDEISALKAENEKILLLKKSLYESLVTGLIDEAEYKEMKKGYAQKLKSIYDRLNGIDSDRRKAEGRNALISEIKNHSGNMIKGGITAGLVESLIERIDVMSDNSIRVKFAFEDALGQTEGKNE